MKQIEVSKASGVVLDYLVSKSDNPPGRCGWGWFERDAQGFLFDPLNEVRYSPSTDWAQGGPIIAREGISIRQWTNVPIVNAYMPTEGSEWSSDGSSALVAAMRCYVASKLGETVEVPEELCTPST